MNLIEKDKAYVWHPFTQMKTAGDPVPVVRGEGVYLYTEDGKRYMDAVSSWWVNIHGHSHPYIAEKVYEQFKTLEHVIFAGFTHPKAVELSERLLNKWDKLSKLFFSDNGSTAVEVGVKMAFQYWYNEGKQKKKIIAFNDAYHGDTFGAMSVSGRSEFTNPFLPFMFDVEYIDIPVKGKEQQVADRLEELVKNEDVAAFIFEPLVQGSGGMKMYGAEALDNLIDICRDHEVLIIADEVMTGFYRTGRMFACDHLRNDPDIVAMSKGLTGGTMALGVTGCSQKIYDAFLSNDHSRTFFHGHSFTANPVACAAACASMDLLEKKETTAHVDRIVNRHKAFKSKIAEHDHVADARQWGTILAIEIDTGEGSGYFSGIRDNMYDFFMERNILLRPLGNVIYILPPYCITDNELDEVYQAIEDFLHRLVES